MQMAASPSSSMHSPVTSLTASGTRSLHSTSKRRCPRRPLPSSFTQTPTQEPIELPASDDIPIENLRQALDGVPRDDLLTALGRSKTMIDLLHKSRDSALDKAENLASALAELEASFATYHAGTERAKVESDHVLSVAEHMAKQAERQMFEAVERAEEAEATAASATEQSEFLSGRLAVSERHARQLDTQLAHAQAELEAQQANAAQAEERALATQLQLRNRIRQLTQDPARHPSDPPAPLPLLTPTIHPPFDFSGPVTITRTPSSEPHVGSEIAPVLVPPVRQLGPAPVPEPDEPDLVRSRRLNHSRRRVRSKGRPRTRGEALRQTHHLLRRALRMALVVARTPNPSPITCQADPDQVSDEPKEPAPDTTMPATDEPPSQMSSPTKAGVSLMSNDLGSELAAALGEPLATVSASSPQPDSDAASNSDTASSTSSSSSEEDWSQDAIEELDDPVHPGEREYQTLVAPQHQRYLISSRATLRALVRLARSQSNITLRARVGSTLCSRSRKLRGRSAYHSRPRAPAVQSVACSPLLRPNSPSNKCPPHKLSPTRIAPHRPPDSGLDLFALSPEMPQVAGHMAETIPPLTLSPNDAPRAKSIPVPQKTYTPPRSARSESIGSPLKRMTHKYPPSPSSGHGVPIHVYAPYGIRRSRSNSVHNDDSRGSHRSRGSNATQTSADLLAHLAEINAWNRNDDAFFDQVDLSDQGSEDSWVSGYDSGSDAEYNGQARSSSRMDHNPFDSDASRSTSDVSKDQEDEGAQHEWEAEYTEDSDMRKQRMSIRGFGRVARVVPSSAEVGTSGLAKVPPEYPSIAQPRSSHPLGQTPVMAPSTQSEMGTSTLLMPSAVESSTANTAELTEPGPAPSADSPSGSAPTQQEPASPTIDGTEERHGATPALRPTSVDWHGMLASSSGMRTRYALAQNPFAQWRAPTKSQPASMSKTLEPPVDEVGELSGVSSQPPDVQTPNSSDPSKSKLSRRSRRKSHVKRQPPGSPTSRNSPFTIHKPPKPGSGPLYVFQYKYGAPPRNASQVRMGPSRPYGAFSFAHGNGWPGPSVPPSPAFGPTIPQPPMGTGLTSALSNSHLRTPSAGSDEEYLPSNPSHGSVSTQGSVSLPTPSRAPSAPPPPPPQAAPAEPGWLRALRRVAQLATTAPPPPAPRPTTPLPTTSLDVDP